jgi:hypothetical protein
MSKERSGGLVEKIILLVLGAVLGSSGTLVTNYVITKESDLVHSVSPPVKFASDTLQMVIYTGKIANRGDAITEGPVKVVARVPAGNRIMDHKIAASDVTMDYRATRGDSDRTLFVEVPNGLNPRQNISVSILARGAESDALAIAASGRGITSRPQQDEDAQAKVLPAPLLMGLLGGSLGLIIITLYLGLRVRLAEEKAQKLQELAEEILHQARSVQSRLERD